VARAPAPGSVAQVRRALRGVLGDHATDRASDEFLEVVRAGMRIPGWSTAMHSHLNLAMARGRARPENVLTDDELRRIGCSVRFIWGDADVYGPPAIGERAVGLMPDADMLVLAGGHAPFLDDPRRCAGVITGADVVG
jgi:pimeloyl-ACP methyl ester carboxylesterase